MTFGGVFNSGAFRAPFGGSAAAAIPWYRAGGAPQPDIAYQPKGAASLAASYINLPTPGTLDAVPVVAPGLGALGWSFTLGTQWLNTGVVPTGTSAMLVQFTRTNQGTVCGRANKTTTSSSFFIIPDRNFFNTVEYNRAGIALRVAPILAAGNLGIAGSTSYRNGASDGAIAGAFVQGGNVSPVAIGCRTNGDTGLPETFFTGTVAAFVYWATAPTALQIAAVEAAMASL